MKLRLKFVGFVCALSALLFPGVCQAGHYTNFNVAVYVPVGVVQHLGNPETLQREWDLISSQLNVDKVYIEVQRDRQLADDALLERVKKFFVDHGVQVAGGMALSDGGSGQFRSFCYTDPDDRKFIQGAAELAARHFDEIIQDDFFFVTTKYASDIAAKGDRSWTHFRLDLMDDAAENLIIKPSRAVNPNVKNIIKFPNWYEHFQASGYDLDKEPKLFDAIYTGTETRDPVITDQHLQQYESYLIFRYFENIKPGYNLGGWVDTFSVRYVDRYAEQLWDTMFAKAPEIMLFNWALLTQPIHPGERDAWKSEQTSFDYEKMAGSHPPGVSGPFASPTMARVAGYSLEQADAVVGQLGNPIGIKSYKPYQSSGEDFLHNYLGMIGIPMDLCPEFPTNADLVLLTESAAADPEIVAKIKGQLTAGKSVIITSGLLEALQGKGIEDIVELRMPGRSFLATDYYSAYGAGNGTALTSDIDPQILFPEIDFFTNDAWSLIRAVANGTGYPLLLMDRYAKGVLYVWTMPENFSDLYRLPVSVVSAIKDHVMTGFSVRLDGPSQVALFAYDNGSFIVESYLPTACDVTVSVAGDSKAIRNLVTGEALQREPVSEPPWEQRRRGSGQQTKFRVHLMPHSYSVFKMEE